MTKPSLAIYATQKKFKNLSRTAPVLLEIALVWMTAKYIIHCLIISKLLNTKKLKGFINFRVISATNCQIHTFSF